MEDAVLIDELAERVLAQVAELEVVDKVKSHYRLHLIRLVTTYKGLSDSPEYSSDVLRNVVLHYQGQLEEGSLSRTSFNTLRRMAADLEDVATTGTFSHEEKLSKWPLPQKQLKASAPAADQSVYENVAVLSALVLSMMEKSGWGPGTVKSYRTGAFPRLIKFFQVHGTTQYSEELVELAIEEAKAGEGWCEGRIGERVRIAAEHMRSVHNDGVLWTGFHRKDSRASLAKRTWLGPIIEEFEQWRLAAGIKPSTIKVNLNYIVPFLEHLPIDGPDGFCRITREQVRDARAALSEGRSPEYVKRMLGPVRVFAMFVEERHPEFVQFGGWIGEGPRTVKRRPIEGYSPEQADEIVASIDESTATGKRDLAVVKLLKTTGLRACDIAGITLDDIDWHSNEIAVTQKKTGVAITMPLDTEAGEALASYILDARRASDSPAVFITAIGQIKPLAPAAVGGIARKYGIKVAGDDFQGYHGSHSFRRGLGTMLVNAGIPVSDVADLLGQVDAASAMPYVALATERLRDCCAGLDSVPIKRKGA